MGQIKPNGYNENKMNKKVCAESIENLENKKEQYFANFYYFLLNNTFLYLIN